MLEMEKMLEPVILLLTAVVGGILGAFFFGGLWWTTRRGLASASPASWFMGSLLVRMAVTLAGFALVSRGRWESLLACLFGFFLARLLVVRLTRPPGIQTPGTPLAGLTTEAGLAKEAGHAP